ncbi:MAG: hypothetical protein L0Y58_16585 [Verrucomicrobia subdivision 3 bacterium]|nr:hypothetical protein [Limisphaerales bacterium]
MKSRNKRSRKKQQQISLQIEELEERIAPGLTVMTPAGSEVEVGVKAKSAQSFTDDAMHGLNSAEAHTGGVIDWTPDA